MNKASSIKKNYIYNMLYQVLILIIPLITAPYLSRVIGAEGVGAYSYTYSIVYYFMLLTVLGLNNYGNRTIAKTRDNKEIMSKNFWGIYIFQLFMGIMMVIFYLIYVFAFSGEYQTISLIETLFILSSILDISWFFFGIEEFKKVITRNTIIKIATLVLIFVFVKVTSDLWKYVLIMSGMTCLSQLVFWFSLKRKVNLVKISWKDITKHIKPNLILFIPVISVSLYKMMDKIMLGNLSNVTEVGYYENAEKIINVPMTVITSLGTVMLPRISNITEKGEDKKVENYISKSIQLVMFLSFAMCLGLIGVGYKFAPVYFGSDFQKTGILIMMLALTLPFISFANVIRTQYLIPKEKDKIYIISVIFGAITNFVMNFIFIPKFQSIGACIGTICAEFVVMFSQTFAVRKELTIVKYIKGTIPYLIKALIMLVCIIPFNFIDMNGVLRLIIQVAIGCLIYVVLNWKYINSIIKVKETLKSYCKRFKTINF